MRKRFALALVLFAAVPAAPAHAATLTVTRFLDMTDSVHRNGVPGSLRYLVETRAAAGDTIVFSRADTTNLTKPLLIPAQLKKLTILGLVGGQRAGVRGRIVIERDANDVTISTLAFASGGVKVDHADRVRVEASTFEEAAVSARWTLELTVAKNSFDGGEIRLFHTYNSDLRDNRIDNKGEVAVDGRDDQGLVVEKNRPVLGSLELADETVTVAENEISGPHGIGIDVHRGTFRVLRATIRENDVRGAARAGISVRELVGRSAITLNTVKGNGVRAPGHGRPSYGIDLDGDDSGSILRPSFIVTDNTVESNGAGGILVRPGIDAAEARIENDTIRDNRGPGIMIEDGSSFALLDLELGGNDGPGIDLAPAGVTPNGVTKLANGNLDWPDLRYDAALQKIAGKTCPRCRVQVYDREQGARKGNPHNGEGTRMIGEVIAALDGSFVYPAGMATISCADAQLVTMTTTLPPGAWATSEFTPDIACETPETGTPGG